LDLKTKVGDERLFILEIEQETCSHLLLVFQRVTHI